MICRASIMPMGTVYGVDDGRASLFFLLASRGRSHRPGPDASRLFRSPGWHGRSRGERNGPAITMNSRASHVSPVFSYRPICTSTASATRAGATRAAGVTKWNFPVRVPHDQHVQARHPSRQPPPWPAGCRRRYPWPLQPALQGPDEDQPATERQHRDQDSQLERPERWNPCASSASTITMTEVMNSKATTPTSARPGTTRSRRGLSRSASRSRPRQTPSPCHFFPPFPPFPAWLPAGAPP